MTVQRFQMSLKIGDLDVDLQTSKFFVLTFKNYPISNFTFQLELFIEHLNVSDGLVKPVILSFKVKLALKLTNFVSFLVNATTFEPYVILASNFTVAY